MARKGSTQLPEFTAHAATTPPEDPDLIEQLVFEHRQVQRLWSELQLAHRRHVAAVHRPEARYGMNGQRDLARQILQLLGEHESLETEALYPRTAPVLGDELVAHALADHAEIRDLLGEVEGEDPEDDGVFEILTEALTLVLAHFDEEERIIFPMLRAVLPGADLAKAGPSARPGSEVVDVAAAERRMAAGDGRRDRLRRRLLRR